MEGAKDWLAVLQKHAEDGAAEFDLRELLPGDQLRVVTKNTTYDLVLEENRFARLSTNRPNRPSGLVRMMGCTFGLSSSIKPDHLFCGGSMEFTFDEGEMVHNTSPIQAMYLLKRREVRGAVGG